MTVKIMTTMVVATTVLFAVGCNCTKSQRTAQATPPPATRTAQTQQLASSQADFVGARGPQGPQGAQGAQGPVGQSGSEGYAIAGPRGPAGPAGPAGQRGSTGAQGAAGELVRGPTGAVGSAGETGATGSVGQSGARGASAEGYVGAAGTAGPVGPQGPTGATGERGPTLVGPAGPTGTPGAAGGRGEIGQTGATGSTTEGVAGPTGVAGPAGPRGPAGPIGQMGPTGIVQNWVSYREFWFDPNMTTIHGADAYLINEIAAYMRANPSLELAIDASTTPHATSQRDLNLRDNRVRSIRNALIAAGASADRIIAGMYGDVDHRRDGRVEVLLRTDRSPEARTRIVESTPAQQPRGTQEQIGVVENWTTLQSFWFDSDSSDIHAADKSKVAEIAAHMKRYPTLQLGIDSSLNPTDPNQRSHDRDLAEQRGLAVHDALIAAGVPASKITGGKIGDVTSRRSGRVEVLIRSDRLAQAR